MRFKTCDGYTLQRTVRRTYPRLLWTDRDLTFEDERGWPVDVADDKLDGEFPPETPLEAAGAASKASWRSSKPGTTGPTKMGGDEDEDGRETLPEYAG